jgi:hypothetical protein
MRRTSLAASMWACLAFGCGAGEGGTITVPCGEARCGEMCVGDGNASGACRSDMCVCQPRVDIPAGPTQGLTSGGAVVRRSSGYQVSVSVGGVSPAAQGTAGTQSVELGLQPQTDPTRLQAP